MYELTCPGFAVSKGYQKANTLTVEHLALFCSHHFHSEVVALLQGKLNGYDGSPASNTFRSHSISLAK